MWEHADIAAAGLAAVSEHVAAVLDLNELGLDMAEVETPPAGIEVARVLARHGVPINELLRSFRLGHACLHRIMSDEAARLSDDKELVGATVLALTEQSFAYVDRVAEQSVVAYQEERGRRLAVP